MSGVTKAQLKRIKKLTADHLELDLKLALEGRLADYNKEGMLVLCSPLKTINQVLKFLKDAHETGSDEDERGETLRKLNEQARANAKKFDVDPDDLSEEALRSRLTN